MKNLLNALDLNLSLTKKSSSVLVVGETHPESKVQRDKEKSFFAEVYGKESYATEWSMDSGELTSKGFPIKADPPQLRLGHLIVNAEMKIMDDVKTNAPLDIQEV